VYGGGASGIGCRQKVSRTRRTPPTPDDASCMQYRHKTCATSPGPGPIVYIYPYPAAFVFLRLRSIVHPFIYYTSTNNYDYLILLSNITARARTWTLDSLSTQLTAHSRSEAHSLTAACHSARSTTSTTQDTRLTPASASHSHLIDSLIDIARPPSIILAPELVVGWVLLASWPAASKLPQHST